MKASSSNVCALEVMYITHQYYLIYVTFWDRSEYINSNM